MDWNNDGRMDAHDYAHYKTVIDSSSSSNCSKYTSNNDSYSKTPTAAKWIVAIIIIYVILKLIGLD
jgi:hypothetical protein